MGLEKQDTEWVSLEVSNLGCKGWCWQRASVWESWELLFMSGHLQNEQCSRGAAAHLCTPAWPLHTTIAAPFSQQDRGSPTLRYTSLCQGLGASKAPGERTELTL